MNWWTSIVYYLWQNSLNRWLEQPLVILSKLAISGLIGVSGAVVILGTLFVGDELNRQLQSRDALAVHIYERVPDKWVSHVLSTTAVEESGWAELAKELHVLNQAPNMALMDGRRLIPIYGVSDMEGIGYADTMILVSPRLPQGLMTSVTIRTKKVMVTVMPPSNEHLKQMTESRDLILANNMKLAPILQSGFTRHIYLQADSVEAIEQMEQVVQVLTQVEGRRVTMRSALRLLVNLRQIREIQGYILLVVTVGAAIALGLICGALAWMEFREERYLLALIRSFGVDGKMLLAHSLVENCLIALLGVVLGITALYGASQVFQGGALNLTWLDGAKAWSSSVFGILLIGALLGGILSCIPVAVGLRRPLGLTLK